MTDHDIAREIVDLAPAAHRSKENDEALVEIIATALAAQRAAGAAAERERIRAIVQDSLDAYPVSVFPDMEQPVAADVNAHYPGFPDRCAAQMSRHLCRELLKLIRAQPVAPPEVPYDILSDGTIVPWHSPTRRTPPEGPR